MNRRDFLLTATGAIGVLALSIKAEPKQYVLYGDGKHDDTEALQAWVDGKDVISGGYVVLRSSPNHRLLTNGDFRMRETLVFRNKELYNQFENCQFEAVKDFGEAPMFKIEVPTHLVAFGTTAFRGYNSSNSRFTPRYVDTNFFLIK